MSNQLEIKEPVVKWIDLFCGAGGTSSGIIAAGDHVLACVNHDEGAIISHKLNHPEVLHMIEDIRTLDLSILIKLVEKERRENPEAIIGLWASLECTNFSNAKGGKPRDADSRSLADYMPNYIEAIQPDIFMVENVREFMSWGPLDDNGKPVSRHAGEDYRRWVAHIEQMGYEYDFRLLNAADYGAYTSRRRYFGQFVKNGLPFSWPEQTHDKTGANGLPKWKPVKDVLDFSDKGESIFTRKKALSEKTLERIYAGLVKYVAGGKDKHEAFIAKYFSGRPAGKVIPVTEPAGTVTTKDGQSLVQCDFVRNISKLVQAQYLVNYHHSSKVEPITAPNPTLTCKDKFSLVTPEFLAANYSCGDNVSCLNTACGTVTVKDRFSIVSCAWLNSHYSTGDNNKSIDSPCGSLLRIPKQNLMQCAMLLNYNSSTSPVKSVNDPSPSITSTRTHYLINPQWFNGSGGSVDNPMHTLIARMDKAPPYLVTTESGHLAIAVYETDSPAMIKIKEFMAQYGIADIFMRMLRIPELLKIQGFPVWYFRNLLEKKKVTQGQIKKYIGNSVEVNQARAIIGAIRMTFMNIEKMTA
jgi:DNA (cytosine-5)-methyltransferase 1